MPHGPVSEWAGTQGFAFSVDGNGQGIALEGKVSGKPWRLQLGRPTRNYILGEEVRARAELGIPEDIAVLVMNRPLKEALEKRAYQIYTDDLQTSVDSTLPEEMRWLAMFNEVGWDGLPAAFWDTLRRADRQARACAGLARCAPGEPADELAVAGTLGRSAFHGAAARMARPTCAWSTRRRTCSRCSTPR